MKQALLPINFRFDKREIDPTKVLNETKCASSVVVRAAPYIEIRYDRRGTTGCLSVISRLSVPDSPSLHALFFLFKRRKEKERWSNRRPA
jgi:hypothetical protein